MDNKKFNKLAGRFWITNNGKNIAGKGRIELLRRIKNTGSISSAAKEMAMSYKAAWDSVNAMNKFAEEPLVKRSTGGKKGGGTSLTPEGENFINLYDKYSEIFENILDIMEKNPDSVEIMSKQNIKTSADNVIQGKITNIFKGAVNTLIDLVTDNGLKIVASITVDAFKNMGLTQNSTVWALIPASRLIVVAKQENGEEILTSASNKFVGKVSVVSKGAVNSEITLDADNGSQIKIVITNTSADNLNLVFGKEIAAYCKASDVLLMS